MKNVDKKPFFAELGALAEVMNESLTELKARVYFEDLSDYPIEVVIKALRIARKEFRWFPRIKEIRDLCNDIVSSMPRQTIPEDHRLPERIELSEEERQASKERIRRLIEEFRTKLGIVDSSSKEKAEIFEERRRELKKQAEELLN